MASETGTLEKLIGVVQNFKTKESSGGAGWIAAGISAIIVLIVVAITAWRMWKAGKETAKLLHEKAVAEEKKHQAIIDSQLDDAKDDQDAAIKRVEEAFEEVNRLGEKIKELDEKRMEGHLLISKITSWEDIDALE